MLGDVLRGWSWSAFCLYLEFSIWLDELLTTRFESLQMSFMHGWATHYIVLMTCWSTIVVVVMCWSWIDRLQFSYAEYLNFLYGTHTLKSIKEIPVKNRHQKGMCYDRDQNMC